MSSYKEKISESAQFLRQNGFEKPLIGVVLGTGLGSLVDKIKVRHVISYKEIPYFPLATVEFHKGQLLFGHIGNNPLVVMQGRFHYYEGYSSQEITYPIRVMQELGVQNLLLSNAAGGMNPDFTKGDLVMILDHINLQPENPLRGLNSPEFGNRFVDMSQPYDLELNKSLLNTAAELNITLKKGIYAAVEGPTLETRAEYRYLRMIGADMVGMSTVPEVIVAKHVGINCAAVSVITDECDPENLQAVNIDEILKVARESDSILSRLFEKFIRNIVK